MGVLTRGLGVAPKDGNAYGVKDGAWVKVLEEGSDTSAYLQFTTVPASSAAAGNPGDVARDAAYFYVYTGNGTTHSWLRIAGASVF
jgi:hypothetical protein